MKFFCCVTLLNFFGRKSNFLNCNLNSKSLRVVANSIRIHTHSELCLTSHHLSDCSYFTGIKLMASFLGTFKTKGVLKSWNERVCHYLGIQRAEEAVSVLQTVDVSSVEAHWGLTGSLRMASLWRASLHLSAGLESSAFRADFSQRGLLSGLPTTFWAAAILVAHIDWSFWSFLWRSL